MYFWSCWFDILTKYGDSNLAPFMQNCPNRQSVGYKQTSRIRNRIREHSELELKKENISISGIMDFFIVIQYKNFKTKL